MQRVNFGAAPSTTDEVLIELVERLVGRKASASQAATRRICS
jgi:hypothetical protein